MKSCGWKQLNCFLHHHHAYGSIFWTRNKICWKKIVSARHAILCARHFDISCATFNLVRTRIIVCAWLIILCTGYSFRHNFYINSQQNQYNLTYKTENGPKLLIFCNDFSQMHIQAPSNVLSWKCCISFEI